MAANRPVVYSPTKVVSSVWELRGVAANQALRNTVRVWGYTDAEIPAIDTDTTTVNFDWLKNSVAGALRLGTSWRASDRPAEERLSGYWDAKATEYRRAVGVPHMGMRFRL